MKQQFSPDSPVFTLIKEQFHDCFKRFFGVLKTNLGMQSSNDASRNNKVKTRKMGNPVKSLEVSFNQSKGVRRRFQQTGKNLSAF